MKSDLERLRKVLPPVPAACPPERLQELEVARAAASVDLRESWHQDDIAASRRSTAEGSLRYYLMLVAEVDGQGTLDLT